MNMEWISVKDRLPADWTTVIVEGGIAQHRKGEWYSLTGRAFPGDLITWTVTHWMPLPNPPKK